MSTEQVFIWEGRFQPIHRGHVAYIAELLDKCDELIVVVVANEVSSERRSALPDFSRIVDRHHGSEKNPWPLWFRYRLVRQTLEVTFPGANIVVLAGHRLDLDWQLYDQLLPPNRTFAVPLRDDFEDAKAEAWESLAQEVQRVEVSHLPQISGSLVRARLESGDNLGDVLEPATYEMLSAYLSSSPTALRDLV
jgi:cytidyltransferase-like protein